MTYRSLPDHVKERLSNYYEHRYQGKMFNEEQILGEISRPLKEVSKLSHSSFCHLERYFIIIITIYVDPYLTLVNSLGQ